MTANLKWKAIGIVLGVLACVASLVALPKLPTSYADVKSNLAERLKLGLDLQGGTHLILQVQVNEALSQTTDQTMDALRAAMREPATNIRYGTMNKLNDTQFVVTDVAPDQASTFVDLVRNRFSNYDMAPATGTPGYLLTLKNSVQASIKQSTLEQSVETIRRRIDQLGLTEPDIREHGRGENEILVQLPGEGDPTRAKGVIQAGGQLEFRIVRGGPYSSEVECRTSQPSGILPPDTVCVRGKLEASATSPSAPVEPWYLLEKRAGATGRDLRSASSAPSTERPGFYEVLFALSTDAGRRFGVFTEANVGKPMAIVLDHKVDSVATIESRIESSGRITGRFTLEQARDLALVLRAGALPASIRYLEERTVGPSLGADSIRQGFRASVGSLIVVMIFMVWYYRLSGWNAVVALVLNLILLLAGLALLRGVLTLPGIAGVILTIGMGVDTSVLVFERIREELRAGKTSAAAVSAGFDRAFVTILDTHVTTIVSCAFLYAFGTGPIRGFAVSLVLGLLANLITGVFISRTILEWHLSRMQRDAQLSI